MMMAMVVMVMVIIIMVMTMMVMVMVVPTWTQHTSLLNLGDITIQAPTLVLLKRNLCLFLSRLLQTQKGDGVYNYRSLCAIKASLKHPLVQSREKKGQG